MVEVSELNRLSFRGLFPLLGKLPFGVNDVLLLPVLRMRLRICALVALNCGTYAGWLLSECFGALVDCIEG